MILARAVEDTLTCELQPLKGPLVGALETISLPLEERPGRAELVAWKNKSKRKKEQAEYFLALLD